MFIWWPASTVGFSLLPLPMFLGNITTAPNFPTKAFIFYELPILSYYLFNSLSLTHKATKGTSWIARKNEMKRHIRMLLSQLTVYFYCQTGTERRWAQKTDTQVPWHEYASYTPCLVQTVCVAVVTRVYTSCNSPNMSCFFHTNNDKSFWNNTGKSKTKL